MNTWGMCELTARDKAGLGVEWETYMVEVMPPYRAPYVYHVGLGIPRLLTRGPNKGRKRWDGPREELWLSGAEVEARAEQYERETGNCRECMGDGKTLARWSATEGTTYRECSRCKGTGKV